MYLVSDKKTKQCKLIHNSKYDKTPYPILIPRQSRTGLISFETYKTLYHTEINKIYNTVIEYFKNVYIQDCVIYISKNSLKETISIALYKCSTNSEKRYNFLR